MKPAETATSTEPKQTITEERGVEPLAPQPTAEYMETLRTRRWTGAAPRPAPVPVPIPVPYSWGTRVVIWKQDRSASELGRQLAYIPGLVLDGPRDARITTEHPGVTPVVRNANGDFIFSGSTPEGDCTHTFAVTRMTLMLCQRSLEGTSIPWAWNAGGNTDPLCVQPQSFTGANAFYSRSGRALRFGYFSQADGQSRHMCRSLDIVAHQTGHAILDGLKPGWISTSNLPQTGALHESFGDLCAIFLAMTQPDQAEGIVALTRANLHDRNYIAANRDESGAALGIRFGLRSADNDLRVSQAGNEVQTLSQVFTGAVYDCLSDIFAFEEYRQRATKDASQVLVETARHLWRMYLQAVIKCPPVGATFADVTNRMLQISHGQKDPPIYRSLMRNRMTARECVVSATPLSMLKTGRVDFENPNWVDGEDVLEMKAFDHVSLHAPQDRSGCCGTMQLPEYAADANKLASRKTILDQDLLEEELQELKKAFK